MDILKGKTPTTAPGSKLYVKDPNVIKRWEEFEGNRVELGKKLRELEIEDANLTEKMALLTREHILVEHEKKYIQVLMSRAGMLFWHEVSLAEPGYDMVHNWEVVRDESSVEGGVCIMRSVDAKELDREMILEILKSRKSGERSIGFGNNK